MFCIGKGIGINALSLNVKNLSKTNRSKLFLNESFSIVNLQKQKNKTLVNIRQEWLKKLYPEKDNFYKGIY